MAIPLLSFFTGGGFFDIGFKQAKFRICWTNENNPAFIEGYEYGMSAWLSSRSPREVTAKIANTDSICNLTAKQVLREAFGDSSPGEFGIIGGPPCPDFSAGGTHAGGRGPNGQLTSVYVDMICKLKPAFFVIENVSGLYRFQKHRKFLEKKLSQLQNNGYAVDCRILNALEFGVPQNRERLFVVGYKRSIAQRAVGRKLKRNERNWFTWPSIEAYSDVKQLPWPKTSPFGRKPRKPVGIPLELCVYSAIWGDGDPEKIANGCEFFKPHTPRFQEIAEGDVARKSFKRLHRYRFSPTAWYGNQEVHLHPWKPRRLSVRESLRIQSVPDEYVMPAELTLSAKFKMICNGVPCKMAFYLASSIKEFYLRGRK